METETITCLKESLGMNNFVKLIEGKEIIDRTIGSYLCTLSRDSKGIMEKTYENKNGKIVYLIENIIPKNHSRYQQANLKLNSAKL